MITANFSPRLRHCTLIDNPLSNETTLVVGDEYFTLERSGDRSKFLQLKSFFDGRHSIADISLKTDLSEDTIINIVSAFDNAGLLQRRHAQPSISVNLFRRAIEKTSLMWRRQIGLHKLFIGLGNRSFRKEVFIGLLLETYHYVRLLPQALMEVVKNSRSAVFRDVILHYAEQELDHYIEYAKSLIQIDRIARHLEESHPTVGTLSLVRNFESIGRRHELSLICCLQLIEARAAEMDDAENDLLAIASGYGMRDLMQPFIDHMKIDVNLGHSDLLEQALKNSDLVSAEAAHTAVNDMHDIKHSFDVFHDSVIAYYDDISNYIPRPRVDFFAL